MERSHLIIRKKQKKGIIIRSTPDYVNKKELKIHIVK